jgi:hypothetical protein
LTQWRHVLGEPIAGTEFTQGEPLGLVRRCAAIHQFAVAVLQMLQQFVDNLRFAGR